MRTASRMRAGESPRQTRLSGLSLLELMFATTVFILLIAGLAMSMLTSMRLNGINRERDVAREAAREKIETILAWRDYPTLAAKFDDTTFSAQYLVNPESADTLPGRIEVDDTNPDLLEVRVSVDWLGVSGMDHIELNTWITSFGP